MADEDRTVFGIKLVEKGPHNLDIGEGTYPINGGRFRGVSIGRTELGYFVFGNRAGSRTYNTPDDIPNNTVEFVRTAG